MRQRRMLLLTKDFTVASQTKIAQTIVRWGSGVGFVGFNLF